MASARKNKRKQNQQAPSDATSSEEQRQSGTKRSKWKGRLLSFCLVLLVLVAVAPTLVSWTALRDWVLNSALAEGQGTISSSSASFGWFTSIELTDLEWKDVEDQPMVQAKRIALDRSLWQLLADGSNLGTISIEEPKIEVRLTAEGSNLEEALAPWLEPTEEEPKPVDLAIQLSDGQIAIHDLEDRVWRLDELALNYAVAASNSGSDPAEGVPSAQTQLALSLRAIAPSHGVATGEAPQPLGASAPPIQLVGMSEQQNTQGRLRVKLAPGESGTQTFELKTDSLPLVITQLVLARVAPEVQLEGNLTTDLSASWKDDFSTGRIEGQVEGNQFSLRAPALGPDHIQIDRFTAPCKINIEQGQLNIEELLASCELGRVDLSGSLLIDGPAGSDDLGSILGRCRGKLVGQVDLARLAAMLPHAMRIREDARLTSGAIDLSVEVPERNGPPAILASVTTRDIAADVSGQRVAWERPIAMSANLLADPKRGANRFVVEQLNCQSDFLQLNGNGSDQKFDAAVSFDLNRLAQQLGQFVDLSGWTIAGTGGGNLNWLCDENQRFSLGAVLKATSFQLTAPGQAAWNEPELQIELSAAGRLDETAFSAIDSANVSTSTNAIPIKRLDSAVFQLRAGADILDARYVPKTAANSASQTSDVLPLEFTMRGDLARWRPRLAVVVPLEGIALGGQCDIAAKADYGSKDGSLRIHQFATTIQSFVFQDAAHDIREPSVTLSGAGNWLASEEELNIADLKFVTSAVTAEVNALTMKKSADGVPKLSGTYKSTVHLDHLSRWMMTPGVAPAHWGVGTVRGGGEFSSRDSVLKAQFNAQGEKLGLWKLGKVTPEGRVGDQIVWQEESPTLNLSINLDRKADQLTIEKAKLQSQTALLNVHGNIKSLSTTKETDLHGTVDYDLDQITPLLAPHLGPNVRFFGKDQAVLKVQGPLAAFDTPDDSVGAQNGTNLPKNSLHWSHQLKAETTFAWEKAVIQGLPLGPARLAAKLHDGRVDFEPLDVAVLEGRVALKPTLYLTPQRVLTLDPGQVIQKVHVTPEIVDQLLRYVAPMLGEERTRQDLAMILGNPEQLKNLPKDSRKDGSFSLALSEAKIYLDQPEASTVTGALSIHKLRVRPGPLGQDLILIGKRVEAILSGRALPTVLAAEESEKSRVTIDDRDVPFQLVNGRVYHRGLTFVADGVTITTSGSVGLDQTIDFLVEVPLLDEWTTGGPIRESLRGHTVRLPVRGTLEKHQIDQQAVTKLNQQLVGSAFTGAVGLLGKELQKGAAKEANQDVNNGIEAGVNTLQWLLKQRQERKNQP